MEKILLQQEKGDFQKSKDLLVRKATELFYRYGYTKTPIRKIPENLKVKDTIIYCYFRNKDGRLFSIIDDGWNDPGLGKCNPLFSRLYWIGLRNDRKKEVKIFVEDTDKLSPEK